MSSDWYAKRLGVTTPPARGISVGPQTVPAQVTAQPQPVQQYQPPPTPVSDQPSSFSEVLRAGRGGPAAKASIGNCPECGSPNLFSQAGGAVMRNDGTMVPPSPKCFDCGYNGRFAQADKANWVAS